MKSGSKDGTRFISTSKYIGISAIKYAPGMPRDYTSNQKRRSPVVLVDLDKVDEPIHDCSTKEMLRTENKKYKSTARRWSTICGHAIGDGEIVVENSIPKDAFKVIPPILVDVLEAIELQGSKNPCLDKIKNLIMNDESQKLLDIVNEIGFDDVEQNFIQAYYGQMLSTHTYGDIIAASSNIGNSEVTGFDIANSIKKSVLSKILKNKDFITIVNNGKELCDNTNFIPEGSISSTASPTNTEFGFPDGYINIVANYGIKLKKGDNNILVPQDYSLQRTDEESIYTIKSTHSTYERNLLKDRLNSENPSKQLKKGKDISSTTNIDLQKLRENLDSVVRPTEIENNRKKKSGKQDCMDLKNKKLVLTFMQKVSESTKNYFRYASIDKNDHENDR